MTPPWATASSSVYVSTQAYTIVLDTGGISVGAVAYRSSCDAFYAGCLSDAISKRDSCTNLCAQLLYGDPVSCSRRCQSTYATDAAYCERFNCGTAASCQTDRLNPTAAPTCCAGGGYNCGGSCYPPCPPRFLPAPGGCQCECMISSCPAPQVLNSRTCRCECPACPFGHVQDPATCQCSCPIGDVDCGGRCVRLGTSSDCSGCGDRCPPGQYCCPPDATNPAYHCASLTTNAGCGTCGNATPCVGSQQCCVGDKNGPRVSHCADLATSFQDCGACFQPCKGNQICVGGQCRCAGGGTPCGTACCTSAQQCCNNNRCVTLSTDEDNCGQCGHACGPSQTCVNGQCTCPQGVLCGQDCCTGSERCCSGQCVDVMRDDNHCGSCTSQCNPPVSSCVSGDCSCGNGYVDAPLAGASPGCCPASTPFAYWNPAYPGNEDAALCCAPGNVPVAAPWTPNGAVCCPPGSLVDELPGGGFICFYHA